MRRGYTLFGYLGVRGAANSSEIAEIQQGSMSARKRKTAAAPQDGEADGEAEAGTQGGDAGPAASIADAFRAPVRPQGLVAKNSLQRKLSALSQYDLFWLSVGVFLLRAAWFFLRNGAPHAPNNSK